MIQYRHIQTGYVIIFSLHAGIFLVTYLMNQYRFNIVPFIVLIVLALCLVLFPTLTVVVTEEALTIRFGMGIIRKRFLLKDIESCRKVKNPWTYGWGIHLTPHGWLYNVSGFYAVEIRMKNGKKYRIGTNEPYRLERALRQILLKN